MSVDAADTTVTRQPRSRLPRLWLSLTIGATLFAATIAWIGPREALQNLILLLSGDTEYAPGYSESAFDAIEVGDTQADVRATLGDPLHEVGERPHTSWLYTASPHPEFGRTGNVGGVSYTEVTFGEDERFSTATGMIITGSAASGTMRFGDGDNTLSLTKAQIAALKASRATPERIEAMFGKPRETFESRAVKSLRYTRSPTGTHHRIRVIGIDGQGRVCRKERGIYWD